MMPVTVVEDPDSRDISIGRPESFQRRMYTISKATSHGEAVEALANKAPGLIDIWEGGEQRGFFFLPRVRIDAVPAGGPNIWKGFADYSSFAPDEFAFEIGGGTEHIVHNDRGPTFRYGVGAEVPEDLHGVIGYEQDGESGTVNGVDIPPNNLSEQYYRKKLFLPGQINEDYIATLNSMRFAVNNAAFYGLAKGEALFLGVSGRSQGNEWELNFRWAASENRTNIKISGRDSGGNAGIITVTEKHGWDYLWLRLATFVGTKDLVKAPVAAYVERLLPRKNFGLLGIGVTLP